MNKNSAIGFFNALLIRQRAAQLASDCSWPYVFGRNSCVDVMIRFGSPVRLQEQRCFTYHSNFKLLPLLFNIAIGIIFSTWMYARSKQTLPK